MNMNNSGSNTHRDGEEPKAPTKLVAALKEPPARRVFVPPAVDTAILRAAQQQFAKPQQPLARLLRPWLFWPAVATACLALAGLAYLASRPTQQQLAREDLNHDGRVDILDAFQLARETQSGTTPTAASDLNQDGVIDHRDAEFIATHAVKLEKGGKS
ncbi:MAG: dockerin type I domain-containing protein [Verrucomicrobiota bacterium]